VKKIERTRQLLEIVERNGGKDNDLLTLVASVWKGVEEWGSVEQREMARIGVAILLCV
jgi:hypothetical protein